MNKFMNDRVRRAIEYLPNGTVSMTQAFVKAENNYAEKVYTTPDRRTVHSYECLTCHAYDNSRMKFLETVLHRNARIREFKAIHNKCRA